MILYENTRYKIPRLKNFESLDCVQYTGSCIYVIRNIDNDKLYVGKTVNYHDRYYQYKSTLSTESIKVNPYLLRAFKKGQNFQMSILENCISDNLSEREIWWIAFFKSTNREYGYNISTGGETGGIGWERSQSTRDKMSKALKGKNKGKSYSHLYRPILTYSADTGEFISEYESIKLAGKSLNTDLSKISGVLSGDRFCANNYVFRYKETDSYPKQIIIPITKRCKRLAIGKYIFATGELVERNIIVSNVDELIGLSPVTIRWRLRNNKPVTYDIYEYRYIQVPSDNTQDIQSPLR